MSTEDEKLFRAKFIYTAQVPGLPPAGDLCLSGAEEIDLPAAVEERYTRGYISQMFFFHSREWITKAFSRVEHPPRDHPFHYTVPNTRDFDDPDRSRQRWSLADVERMILWFYQEGVIEYRIFICARQVIAWTARGMGVYV